MRMLYALARSPLPLPFKGLAGRRSLVSTGNIASAVIHALAEPKCARAPFLVADPQPATVAEMIAALRRGLGRGPRLFTLPSPALAAAAHLARRGEAWQRLVGNLVADTAALQATGWRPGEVTAEALAAAVRADRG
jgi:UDP-glucose 4-epimerase